MDATVTLTTAELPEVLLNVATVRPVFVWGPPGIGKSSIVRDFADAVGLPCQTLLGTQLAPEDLIGVPQIVGDRSRFAPPESIARDEPYVLFLDELNASSTEVQKAFYSLILDRRLGTYELPAGSVVIGAGNRATDQALARAMPSALVNRMIHVHLRASPRDWLAWADAAGIHPWVTGYLRQRPDHLTVPPPKTERTFSTPRSWHMLSDALHAYAASLDTLPDDLLLLLAAGTVSPEHAASFKAYVRLQRHAYGIDQILKGAVGWPTDPQDSDLLYFLASSLRARLVKELPADRAAAGAAGRELAHRAKALLTELAAVNAEVAQLVVAAGDDGRPVLPGWFTTELVRDLPRLVAVRA